MAPALLQVGEGIFCILRRCSACAVVLSVAASCSIIRSSTDWKGSVRDAGGLHNVSTGPSSQLWPLSREVQELARLERSCFDTIYDRQLSWQNVLIDHTDKLNSLNLPQFNVHVSTTPQISAPGDEEFMALHFSDKPDSASDTGFSMFGNSNSLRIVMSDGSHRDNELYTGWDADVNKEVTYSVGCWMTDDYANRWCKVVVNGIFYGSRIFAVPGNIYKLDGGQFGQGKFNGRLNYIKVCDSTNGTLENTFVPTTTETTTTEGFHRRRRGTETCNECPCEEWHMQHVTYAERIKCRSKVCSALDVETCCEIQSKSDWPQAPDFSGFPGFDTEPGEGGQGGAMRILWICIFFLFFTFCCSAGSCTAYMKYKEWQMKKPFDVHSYNAYDFLEVPQAISKQKGQEVVDIARCLLECEAKSDPIAKNFWPRVYICCPLGQRRHDAEGCGPGMYYALAVSILLFQSGIKCFCSLMVPGKKGGGPGEQVLYEKIKSSESSCKVFVIVQFSGLYQSLHSLREISTAMAVNIDKIIPLAFERPLPLLEDQWPMLAAADRARADIAGADGEADTPGTSGAITAGDEAVGGASSSASDDAPRDAAAGKGDTADTSGTATASAAVTTTSTGANVDADAADAADVVDAATSADADAASGSGADGAAVAADAAGQPASLAAALMQPVQPSASASAAAAAHAARAEQVASISAVLAERSENKAREQLLNLSQEETALLAEETEEDWLTIQAEVRELLLTSEPGDPDSVVTMPEVLPGVVADIKRALGMDFDMHSI